MEITIAGDWAIVTDTVKRARYKHLACGKTHRHVHRTECEHCPGVYVPPALRRRAWTIAESNDLDTSWLRGVAARS